MTRYYINYGGASETTSNVFYIFTTGIVNWGNFHLEDQNLIMLWNNQVRDHIFSMIPIDFQIVIIHYDPLIDIDKITPENIKLQQVEYVNQNLIPSDLYNERIIQSEFRREGIDIGYIPNPHLILDFAHLFQFNKDLENHVKISEEGQYKPLNVLRTGFIGNGFGRDFTLSNTARIDPIGKVKTYVDKMIELGIDFDDKNPEIFFENILKNIIIRFENTIKKIKGEIPFFRIEHIIEKVKPQTIDIINSIMARFWNDMPVERIINEVIDYYIRINIETITSMDPKEKN